MAEKRLRGRWDYCSQPHELLYVVCNLFVESGVEQLQGLKANQLS